MTIIKCSCNTPECPVLIYIDGEPPEALNMRNRHGGIQLMYLDETNTPKLITELQSVLKQIEKAKRRSK